MFSALVAASTLLGAALGTDALPSDNVAAAYHAIRSSFPVTLEDGYYKCRVTDTETCDIESMEDDVTTVVYPGGDTRCIFDSELSGDFGFQVIPGNTSKGLLLYWQGGGACWDRASTLAGLCTTSAKPSGSPGVFDRTNELNPYRDWTIVNILYCSGDVHGGQTVRDYDYKGSVVNQTGAANAQASLDWILSQEEFKNTAQVVLAGASAGSMGVQLWATSALEQLAPLHFSRTAVIPDSFIGYFPPTTESGLIVDFGYCDASIIAPSLVKACKAGTLLFKDIVDQALAEKPEIPFAYLNSKTDAVQISYYTAIAATSGRNVSNLLSPAEYYAGISGMLQGYADAGRANMVAYLVDSSMHTYTDDAYMYTADASGLKGGSGDYESMLGFISQLPMATGDVLQGACDGDLEAITEAEGTAWCDSALDGRLFEQGSQQ